jgi:hypothetical protein
MVITPHVAVGAALGRGRRSTLAAAGIGFASHYLLDAIPHRDYTLEGVPGALRLVVDSTLAGAVLVLVRADRMMVSGALAALVPDVLAVSSRHGLPTPAHDRLHEATHAEAIPGPVWGWAPQIAVAVGLVVALRQRSTAIAA